MRSLLSNLTHSSVMHSQINDTALVSTWPIFSLVSHSGRPAREVLLLSQHWWRSYGHPVGVANQGSDSPWPQTLARLHSQGQHRLSIACTSGCLLLLAVCIELSDSHQSFYSISMMKCPVLLLNSLASYLHRCFSIDKFFSIAYSFQFFKFNFSISATDPFCSYLLLL